MVACHSQLRPQLCLRITNNPTSHPENDTEKKELNGNDKVDTTTAQTDSPADVTKSEPVAPATTTTTTAAATTEPESKTDAKAENVAEKKAEEKVVEPAPAVAADKKVADKVEDVKPTKVEDKRKDLILPAPAYLNFHFNQPKNPPFFFSGCCCCCCCSVACSVLVSSFALVGS